MEEEKALPLRVLYTVNTSPQYVLAKSQQNVPVTTVRHSKSDDKQPSSSQVYGRTYLQCCAMTLCQSSPEIISDSSKDYSVYVLDPLEDIQSKARYGSAAANSRGVAVGMGLLSTVLNQQIPTSLVTGTIIDCDSEDASLEVVISLRQVQAMPSFLPPMPHHPHMNSMQPFTSAHLNPKRKQSSSRDKDSTRPIFATTPLPPFAKRASQQVEEEGATPNGPLYHLPPSQYPHFYYPSHPGYPGHPPPPMVPHPYYAPAKTTGKESIAALLPTPYIGPPRRPPGRPKLCPPPSVIEITDSPAPVVLGSACNVSSQSESDSASDLQPSSDASDADISSCSTPEPLPRGDSSAAQNAAILGALSSISSKADLASIEAGTPSPELVNLLKLYLAAVESKGKSTDQESKDVQESSGSTAITPIATFGKENSDPSRSTSSALSSKQVISEPSTTAHSSSTPLGTGAFNSRTQSNDVSSTKPEGHTLPESTRKRRLSDYANKEIQVASSRRAIIATSVSGRRTETASTSSAEEVLVKAKSQSSLNLRGKTPLFPSAGSGSTSSRKGPYVVPEWARGVPAPSPPRRSGIEDTSGKNIRSKKTDKIRKSKSMGRLGGKNHGAQTSPARPTAERSAELNELERMLSESLSDASEPSDEMTLKAPFCASAMPVIAQSSPVSNLAKIPAFRAFDTSPLRLVRITTSSGERLPPSTPIRLTSNPAFSSPLFTPSPPIRKGSPRRLVGFDALPSPSPMTRRKRSVTPGAQDSESEDSDCRSNSLPIASDDDFVFKRPATPTTPKLPHRFDWKSLDLPPSSPPKTSPMKIPYVTTEADVDVEMGLPGVPSSDPMQESETSSEECLTASSSEMPSTPRPDSQSQESRIGTTWPTFPENIDFSDATDVMMLPDRRARPPEFQLSSLEQASPSTKAMFEALQNGLGEEDFSETWKLMNDVMQPTVQSFEHGFGSLDHSWFGELNGAPGLSSDTNAEGEVDAATMAATAFEDLLSGCLV